MLGGLQASFSSSSVPAPSLPPPDWKPLRAGPAALFHRGAMWNGMCLEEWNPVHSRRSQERPAYRDERNHTGVSSPPCSLPQAITNQWLPWAPGDTLPSARHGPQSEPRTARCQADVRLHARLWHRRPVGSRGQGNRAGPASSRTLESKISREKMIEGQVWAESHPPRPLSRLHLPSPSAGSVGKSPGFKSRL